MRPNQLFLPLCFALAILLSGCGQEEKASPRSVPVVPKLPPPVVKKIQAPALPSERKNPRLIIFQPHHGEVISTEQSIIFGYSFDQGDKGDYISAYLDNRLIVKLDTPDGRYALGLTGPGQHTLSLRLYDAQGQFKEIESAVVFIADENVEVKNTTSKLIPTASQPVKRKPKKVETNPWKRNTHK